MTSIEISSWTREQVGAEVRQQLGEQPAGDRCRCSAEMPKASSLYRAAGMPSEPVRDLDLVDRQERAPEAAAQHPPEEEEVEER